MQTDGSLSNQDLAEKILLSPSACLRRTKLLEDERIIKGYKAIINAERLGIEFEALVHVSLKQDKEDWHENFVEKVNGWSEVTTVYSVTGSSNYILYVQCPNLKHYKNFIVEKLNKTDGVIEIHSEIVLEKIKDQETYLDFLPLKK
ncbi:Leucine-responsive regulatory protein [compost metagenome]